MKSAYDYYTPSYFWSCIKLDEDCPYFSTSDPKLFYFAIVLTCLYIALILMTMADLKFYWTLDQIQQQFYYQINIIRKKIRHVQLNQNQLVSTKERTIKQLKRSQECKHIVTELRRNLNIYPDEDKNLLADGDKQYEMGNTSELGELS